MFIVRLAEKTGSYVHQQVAIAGSRASSLLNRIENIRRQSVNGLPDLVTFQFYSIPEVWFAHVRLTI